jgi:hypothetical protein
LNLPHAFKAHQPFFFLLSRASAPPQERFIFEKGEENYSLPRGNLDAGIYDVIIKLNFIWLILRAPPNFREWLGKS